VFYYSINQIKDSSYTNQKMEKKIYPITTIALNDEKLDSIGFRIFCGSTINKFSGSKHPGLY